MAKWKPKSPSRSGRSEPSPAPPMSKKLRRHYKEKARREQLIRRWMQPGVKDRFVSGCLALLIVGVLAFIAFFTYACFVRE